MQDKREYWFHHVELWNNSGLSQAEYARQNQLSLRKLNYYKRLLLRTQPPQYQPLIPAVVIEETTAPEIRSSGITLVSPTGFHIELGDNFDQSALHKVITILKEVA